MTMDRAQYKAGVLDAIPVGLGFLPIAFAYAAAASDASFSAVETTLMSLFVFGGASQMMAVGMLAGGAAPFMIVLATLIMNLRHFIMSTCVFNRMEPAAVPAKLLMAHGVTDESFALFTTEKGQSRSVSYFLGLFSLTYFAWVSGAVLGALVLDVLPPLLADSLGISLYAVFIAILAPEAKKSVRLMLLVIGTACLNFLLRQFMDPSWALIAATLGGAAVGVFTVDLPELAAPV